MGKNTASVQQAKPPVDKTVLQSQQNPTNTNTELVASILKDQDLLFTMPVAKLPNGQQVAVGPASRKDRAGPLVVMKANN